MSEPAAGRGPFRQPVTIRFSDVDHAGILYYPRFFHYFHVAFEELFRARLGADSYRLLLDRDRIGLPAVRAECEYRSPLRFADAAEIEVGLIRMGTRSVTLSYRVERVECAGAPLVSAVGHVTSVAVNLDTFQAVDVPAQVRALFLELAEPPG